MTYNVFGGTLSLTQSMKASVFRFCSAETKQYLQLPEVLCHGPYCGLTDSLVGFKGKKIRGKWKGK